jgi:hypothetical protein
MLTSSQRACRFRKAVGLTLGSLILAEGAALPVLAQEPPPTALTDSAAKADDIDAAIAAARDQLRRGQYDEAAVGLKRVIAQARSSLDRLRQAYLLLVLSYVYRANSVRNEPGGQASSEGYMRDARRYVLECLTTQELRDTRPEPVDAYPPEMVSLFAEVRAEMLGAFRVSRLLPPDAIVILDGDTLRTGAEREYIEQGDLPAGLHEVFVQHAGYRPVREEIRVPPGAAVERSYELSRDRRRLWYGVLAGTVIGGLATFLVTRGDDEKSPAPVLPEPPLPPR